MTTAMNAKLLPALALLPLLFSVACDDPTDLDPQTAEMIEICEELDGDCDEEIEAYLAEIDPESEDAAQSAVPFDPPDDFTGERRCTHCGDGPRQSFHAPAGAPQQASNDALDFAAGPDEPEPCPPPEHALRIR
jgi:hypothetical protein